MPDQSLPFYYESAGPANAPVEQVFDFLDDPKALAAHMGESSQGNAGPPQVSLTPPGGGRRMSSAWGRSIMMLGSRLSIDVDGGGGRVIGSKVRMQGRMLGIRLSLEEVITKRQVPAMKVWETIGTPKLLVISHYRMGFELTRNGASSLVRVFIAYSLPINAPGAWLGHLLGAAYARWCTRQMVMGAARHFT